MQVGNGFEQMLYQLVAYLIAGAALFLFLQLLIYSTITIKKFKRSKNLKRLLPAWSRHIDTYLRTGRKAGILALDSDERISFRDLLISYYCGSPQDPSNPQIKVERSLNEGEKRRVRLLYMDVGYLNEDMRTVEEGLPWEKAVALGRLGRLQLNDAEDLAADMLEEGNRQLMLSCISYLASIQSRFLSSRLSEIVSSGNERQFKELMVELIECDPDTASVKALARSSDPRCRRGAAILLGRSGRGGNVQVLKGLSEDQDPKVRAEVARSLSRIGTARASKVLADMVWDMDDTVGSAVEDSMESAPAPSQISNIWETPSPMGPGSSVRENGMMDVWGSDSIMGK